MRWRLSDPRLRRLFMLAAFVYGLALVALGAVFGLGSFMGVIFFALGLCMVLMSGGMLFLLSLRSLQNSVRSLEGTLIQEIRKSVIDPTSRVLADDVQVETAVSIGRLPRRANDEVSSSKEVRVAIGDMDSLFSLLHDLRQPAGSFAGRMLNVGVGDLAEAPSEATRLMSDVLRLPLWPSGSSVSPSWKLLAHGLPMTFIETDKAVILILPPTRDDMQEITVLTLRGGGPLGRSVKKYLDHVWSSAAEMRQEG